MRVTSVLVGFLLLSIGVTATAQQQSATRRGETIDLRSAPRPSAQWTVRPASCRIYGKESPDLREGLFKVTTATRLSNGTIVAASNAGVTLHYFDANGKVIAHAGGRGGGPGEIDGPALFVAPYRGDSVIARSVGRSAYRPAIFGPDGTFVRSLQLETTAERTNPGLFAGALSDGGLISVVRPVLAVRAGQDDVYRIDSIAVRIFDASGKERRSIGPLADVLSAHAAPKPGAGGRITVNLTSVMPGRVVRWGGSGANTVAAGTNVIYHFDEQADALVIYDLDGTVRRRVLIAPLSGALRPASGKAIPFADAQRLDVLSDRAGHAWVEVARDRVDSNRRWWILDADGRWIAEATTPPMQEQLLEVNASYVLLLRKDNDGIETVAYCPM